MKRSVIVLSVAGLAGLAAALPVQAGSLVYQPVNPAFGGSPLNGSWLQSEAQAQNEFQRKEQRRQQILNDGKTTGSNRELTPGQIFARQLQSQLYSSLANQISSAIFGENAQQSGTFKFEGTVVTFHRVGPNVQITINDGQSETTVVVPAGAP